MMATVARVITVWRAIAPVIWIDRNNSIERWDGDGEGRATAIVYEGLGVSAEIFVGRTPRRRIGPVSDVEPLEHQPDAPVAAKPRIRICKGNWVRHTPGPFPFHPETVVETIHADGLAFLGRDAEFASFWHENWWRGTSKSWRRNIVFYRIIRTPHQVGSAADLPDAQAV